MEHLRESFLKTYANIPLALRDETILILKDETIDRPISWNVAYLEVKTNTELSEIILKELRKLDFI